ncbi:MAG: glutamine--fructose-6-phosphate transaminase (isomerizing) [Acidimicrobiaceae bacterium]|nr:glutamine--fructose-6-phosphate transaminase (isomerizing) [Acidimicrobiaceae bacterium]
MCGIIGSTGEGATLNDLLEGLARLEYRGYDSAGVAVARADGTLDRIRAVDGTASLELLAELAKGKSEGYIAGLGHTRWATHGRVTTDNAHPHFDCSGRIGVVHNGIVENFRELKSELEQTGHVFSSQTDTEVIAHLLEDYLKHGSTLKEAVTESISRLRGAMSFVALDADDPKILVATKRMAPLIAGSGSGANFVASDIPAILGKADTFYQIGNDQVVVVSPGDIKLFDLSGNSLELPEIAVEWDLEAAVKGGYPDFMSKEIFEQPAAVRDTLLGRLNSEGEIVLDEMRLNPEELRNINKVFIVGCGTSFHAGMVAKFAIEHWTRIPVELDISSEFRYRDPVLDPQTLVIGVSQSGETLDTMAAMNEASMLSAKTLVVSNVMGSSMARAADAVLYTRAGPEIGVAATKTHTSQIAALLLLALYLAQVRHSIYPSEIADVYSEMIKLPQKIEEVLASDASIEEVAQSMVGIKRFYFIGRQVGYPVALEGALKLKEISYLPAEGYPAGELKHGPIAMIDSDAVVFGIVTRTRLWEKTISNVEEVRVRGAKIVLIANQGDSESEVLGDVIFEVPKTHPLLAPVLDVIPLQLFAYHLAVALGNDVDRPRNLAKTVTVE